MLLALVPVLLRGHLEERILFVQLAILVGFFVLVGRWEFPGLESAGRRRMFVYLVLAPMLALAAMLSLAPLAATNPSPWLAGAVILLLTGGVTVAVVLIARKFERTWWVVVATGITVVATIGVSVHAEIEPRLWQAAVVAYFALLFATALLRGIAYANTWLRGAIAFLGFAVAVYGICRASTAARIELGPWESTRTDQVAFVLVAAILVLVLVDGWRTPAEGYRTTRVVARRFSLTTASLGTAALTAACMMATFGADSVPIPAGVTVLEQSRSPRLDIAALAKDPAQFAARFSPVLLFRDADHWEPIWVEDYLRSKNPSRNAWTEWSDGSERLKATPALLSDACPGPVHVPCRVVTIDCDDRRFGERCDRGPGYVAAKKGGSGRALVYARVVDLTTCRGRRQVGSPVDDECKVSATGRLGIKLLGRYRKEVRFLVQYWYFYFYDRWSTTSLFGDLTQTHEGDWEAVTIGFSDATPLFAGFSRIAAAGGRTGTMSRSPGAETGFTRSRWLHGGRRPCIRG
jgi:hypothetical protein